MWKVIASSIAVAVAVAIGANALATASTAPGSATKLGATPDARQSSGSGATVIKVAFNKKLKTDILVGTGSRTLYLFTYDAHGASTCTQQAFPGCPKTWPAVTSAGPPVAGVGINARLLGLVKRANGARQVTYNHHPLYYFSGDHAAGDVNGQGCYGYWFVLSGKGTAIQKPGPPC
jgi:predicted lipoprotein with Yx(FWY)xxD motif